MKKFFISCAVPAAAIALFATTGCATQQQNGTGGATASSSAQGAPVCGNGVLEPGEECDGMVPPWAPKGQTCSDQCALLDEMPPLINEIYYPQGSAVGCFLEILGSPGYDLTDFGVFAVNATDGTSTIIAPLKGMTIGDTGYFLVVQDTNVIVPMGVNSLMSPATHFMDGPGNVTLMRNGKPVDSLGWGFATGGVFVGEGAPAANPNAGGSLCRVPSGVHTMSNSADFKSCKPTPGAINFLM